MDISTIHTLEHIHRYISNQAEENIHLDFKRGDALRKDDKTKNEIAKDVSAFANSDGGIIIYGIEEIDNIATNIVPVNANETSKEWLEQVISNRIKRPLQGVIIDPIRINDSGEYVFVVRIPKSRLRPHQTLAHRYFKRNNFESIDMEEHEVRDGYEHPLAPFKIIETPQEAFSRVRREKEQQNEREALLSSEKSVKMVIAEVDKLRPLLNEQQDLMLAKDKNWHIGPAALDRRSGGSGKVVTQSFGFYLAINFEPRYNNTASGFSLTISITTGGRDSLENIRVIDGIKYTFGISLKNQIGWFSTGESFSTTEEIVKEWYDKFISEVTIHS